MLMRLIVVCLWAGGASQAEYFRPHRALSRADRRSRKGKSEMRSRLLGVIVVGLLSGAVVAAESPSVFLTANCLKCHGPEKQKGDFRVDKLEWPIASAARAEEWRVIAERVAAGEMPPKKDATPPPAKDIASALAAINTELSRAAVAFKDQIGSDGAFRRLNRMQYQNTINDLLGTHSELATMLPRDATGRFGFDRIGSALHMSGEQIQNYMAVAEYALLSAMPRPEDLAKPELKKIVGIPKLIAFNGEKKKDEPRKDLKAMPDGGFVSFKGAIEYTNLKTSTVGRYHYKLRVAHGAYQSPDHTVYARIASGETTLAFLESKPGAPVVSEFEIWLSGGNISVAPLLDIPHRPPFRRDWSDYTGAGLLVQSIELEGPFIDEWPPRGRVLLFGDLPLKEKGGSGRSFADKAPQGKDNKSVGASSANPAADANKLLTAFLPKAFRRPVTPEEVAKFTKIVTEHMAKSGKDSKNAFHDAMILAYTIALSSPDFLFLQEPKGKLNDYAIACRLSYFLTGSMPDDALFAAAKEGKLKNPEGRLAEARRLLDAPSAQFFIRDFVDQWLDLRDIDATLPDQKMYPEFDPVIKDAMVQETRLFFAEILKNDLSIANFVDSDWTFLNSRLASHYGISGVEGVEMRKVTLPKDCLRGGVLTQASVLKVTANGSVTSPVKRGKWILEQLIGRPPPPPPPNVAAIESDVRGTTTIREQLAKHRQDVSCNSCHVSLDPHGFALESFDVIGGFRTKYRVMGKVGTSVPKAEYKLGPDVQAADVLPDGRSFKTVSEYKKLLLTDSEQIARALTEKMLVYALGRDFTFADHQTIREIVADLKKKNYGLRTLVMDVVQSELFITK